MPWWARLKTWCQLSKPQGPPPEGLWQVVQDCIPTIHGEEVQWAEVCQHRLTLEPLPSPGPGTPSELRGLAITLILDVGNVGSWDITEGNAPL